MAQQDSTAFFSYARTDSDFALRLARDLKSLGAPVWLDQLDISPGQRWDKAIEEALAYCDHILVILSPAAINSNNVMDEVSYALEEQKTVVPVFHVDCAVPFRLRRLQYADFRTDYQTGLNTLLTTLRIVRPTPASELESQPPAAVPAESREVKNQQIAPRARGEFLDTSGKPDDRRVEHSAVEATRKAESVAETSSRSGPRTGLFVGILALASLTYVLRNAMGVSEPWIQQMLKIPTAKMSFSFSAFLLANAIFSPLAGIAVDKFGTRRIVSIGLVVTALATALLSLSYGFTALFVFHAVLGCGISVFFPAWFAIFALIKETRRGLANAVVEAVYRVSVALLPITLVPAVALFGWRSCFMGLAVAAAVLSGAWLIADRAVGIGTTEQGLRFITQKTAITTLGAYTAFSYGWSAIFIWVQFFYSWHGLTRSSAATIDQGLTLTSVFSGILSGWLSDRFVNLNGKATQIRKRFVVGGFLVSALAGVLVPVSGKNAPLVIALIFLYCAGFGVVTPSLWALVQGAAPPGRAGSWAGMLVLVGGMASFLASSVFEAITRALGAFASPAVEGILALAAGCATWFFLDQSSSEMRARRSL